MMNDILEFLRNDANENEGLGDAGIATFQDRPYASAAKEAGQNSRDAMHESPVKMVFKLHKIPREEIPGIEKLIDTVESCVERVDRHYNEKEEDFFLKAQQVLEQDTINVLQISDYNTRGLEGPAIDGKPFYALLKGTGVSDKGDESGEASSGSFGIGKNASFAISELRTVYYSTVYFDEEQGKDRFLAQGKVKLVSHVDKDDEPRKATGWWGLQGFHPITDENHVPEWMRRNVKGTSVFSIGFRLEENWEYRVIAALVRTFFIAIRNGDMEFTVGDIQITADSLNKLFDDSAVLQAVEDSHLKEDFDFAKALYKCDSSPDSDLKKIAIKDSAGKESGFFEVKILKSLDLPKRVGFVRNGMLISDNLKTFGHSYSRFPMCADFIALVTPSNKLTGSLLKRLENPAHDQFSAERIADDQKRAEARSVLEKVGKEVRNLINEVTKSIPEDEEAVDELAEYFASPEELDDGEEGDPSIDRYRYRSVPRTKRTNPVPGKGKGKKGGGTGKGSGSGGGSGGSGSGSGKGKTGVDTPIPLGGVRNIEVGTKRKLFFTPSRKGNGLIQVSATGLSDNSILTVISCDNGEVKNGRIKMNFDANVRVNVEVEFSESYHGPIELDAYLEASDEDK